MLRHLHEDRALRLPLDGGDLTALGLSGPAVGRALAALRRAWLDGEIASREEALARVRRRARLVGARGARATAMVSPPPLTVPASTESA